MPPPIPTATPDPPGLWLAVVAMGAYHGLNPGMGWLFALALALQQGREGALLWALLPLSAGHALSIALVAGAVALAGALLPLGALRLATGALLVAFGLLKLLRPRHPRWVGMRVGTLDLGLWSFLMATAHGAGLMLAPVLVPLLPSTDPHCHHLCLALPARKMGLAVGLHTLALFLTMGAVAWVVYRKVGLAFLRRGWVNFDLLWALALLVVGGMALLKAGGLQTPLPFP